MPIYFNKTNWKDAPSTATPITAAQLNRMEKGISDCVEVCNTIPTIYTFKGTVFDVSELPLENNKMGDTYNISTSGQNYAWNGTQWVEVGISIDFSESLGDYIVEQGNSNGWDYRIYKSGFKVCSYTHQYNGEIKVDVSDGSMYFGALPSNFKEYPFEFEELPSTHIDYIDNVFENVSYKVPCFLMKSFGTTTYPPNVWLYRPTIGNVLNPQFKITAWGY